MGGISMDIDPGLQQQDFQVMIALGTPVVVTPAEITAANAQQFWEVLATVGNAHPAVVVDMDCTTSLGCDGKSALLMALRSGTQVRVVASDPEVRQTLIESGLDRILRMHDSLAAALADTGPTRSSTRVGAQWKPIQARRSRQRSLPRPAPSR